MKKIMVLGASILQLPAIEKSIEMGLTCIAVDMDPFAVGFNVPGVIKEVISTIDTDGVLKAAKKHGIDGIMTLASDMPMMTVATVCEELGLPGITKDTAYKATNKAAMRNALKAAGVPIPMYCVTHDYDEFISAVSNTLSAGYNTIIKPADNSGSRGISFIRQDSIIADENGMPVSYKDDRGILRGLAEAYEYTKGFSKTGTVLVEECMEGPEVSVETLSFDGECHVIQITDKITNGAPYFVEMGHTQPSRLPRDVREEIKKVTKAAAAAIGIKNGPTHTEIKVTKDGPKIVELGARLGGDNITTYLVPLSTGVDMVEACIKLALGDAVDIMPKFNRGSAIRYFVNEPGIIKKISGISEAKNSDNVKNVTVVHDEGEEAKLIRSSNDRVGFVITDGTDADDAEEKCETALAKIKVDVE